MQTVTDKWKAHTDEIANLRARVAELEAALREADELLGVERFDQQFSESEDERNERLQRRREARKTAPYGEWCHDPDICRGKGYCPRDPTCGD